MSDDNEYPKIQGRNIKLLPVFAVLNHDLITPFRRCEVYVPVFLPSLEWERKALQHDHSGDGMPSFWYMQALLRAHVPWDPVHRA